MKNIVGKKREMWKVLKRMDKGCGEKGGLLKGGKET